MNGATNMHSLTQRLPAIALVSALAIATLFACTKRQSDDPSESTAGIDSPSVSVLRRGNLAEPTTLDPAQAEGLTTNNVMRDLFEGLLRESRDGEREPGVAASWEILDDGKTYLFQLREDARWSNGDPLVAEDFAASFRRTLDPATNSTYASSLAPIVNATAVMAGELPPTALGIAATDTHTLEIRLESPTPYFLNLLLTPPTFPVHRASLAEHGDAHSRPDRLVSNGAYRVVSWRIGDRLVAEKNPHYWDADSVAIDRVEFLPIEDATTELTMFQAGELDITSRVPSSKMDQLKESYPAQLEISPSLGTYFIGIDTTEPPLDDVRLRKALSIAIDRDALTSVVLSGTNPGAYAFVPTAMLGYDNYEYAWQQLPRDEQLDMARALYAQAGYSEAQPLRIQLLYNTSDNHRKIMLAVQDMLRKNLGVDASLVNQEWKVMLQTRKDFAAWDLIRFGWNGDYPDANNFLEVFRGNNSLNVSGWANETFDTLLDQAGKEIDSQQRAALLREAEQVLLDAYPMIPLYFYTSKHLVSERVEGFNANIMDRVYTRHMTLADND
ncbi:MAG: peptide ABC transporter substrate-binding protein [Pseudomonadota bacterium]